MAIEFDPAKAKTNLRKLGVSFAHTEQALRDPVAISIEDADARGEQRFVTAGTDSLVECGALLVASDKEQRFVTLGTDSLGRVVVAIHTQREERTRLISARKASRGEADR